MINEQTVGIAVLVRSSGDLQILSEILHYSVACNEMLVADVKRWYRFHVRWRWRWKTRSHNVRSVFLDSTIGTLCTSLGWCSTNILIPYVLEHTKFAKGKNICMENESETESETETFILTTN